MIKDHHILKMQWIKMHWKEENHKTHYFIIKEQFDLKLVNEIAPTTMGKYCLDVVFARYIPNITSFLTFPITSLS